MRNFHFARLLALAAWLEKIPTKTFNFGLIAFEDTSDKGKPMLIACAIGWLPAVFPRVFKWYRIEGHCLDVKDRKTGATNFDAAETFFGITGEEVLYLLNPGGVPWMPNRLTDKSSAQTVAKHIRKFVARKQKEGAKLATR